MGILQYITGLYKGFLRKFFYGPSWLWRKDPLAGEYISPSFMLFVWCYGFLNRIFTHPGWMLFLVCLATAFYATIMIRSAVTILFLVLAGLFLVNGLILLVLFPRLKITRKVPQRVVAGRIFSVRYEIENLSPFPCFSLLADPLLQGKNLVTDRPEYFTLPGKGKICCTRKIMLAKRGVWDLPAATVESAFPFGLLKASFCDHRRVKVIVHPAWKKWQKDLLAGSGKSGGNRIGKEQKKSFQKGMDLSGCREYVYGDPPGHIHWANSAKWGRFVVKEFEEEKSFRQSVILDTFEKYDWKEIRKDLQRILHLRSFASGERKEIFESIFALASSLAVSFSGDGYEMDFYIPVVREFLPGKDPGKEKIRQFFRKWFLGMNTGRKECTVARFPVGNKEMKAESFLDELSAMQKVPSRAGFEDFTSEILEKIRENPSVLLVLRSCDGSAEKLYGKLVKMGCSCRVLYVTGEKDKKEFCPAWAEKVTPEELLSGKWMGEK